MRYFIGFLVTVGLIILLIVLLFNSGNSKPPSAPKSLTSYASTDAEVSMTIDGPINATSEHDQVRVTVNRDDVTYQHLKGYDGDVVDTQIFANTENSYDVFLHALLHAGFTKGDNSPALRDERGYCPTGERYIFELNQDNDNLERYWATSCGKPKTYLGLVDLTKTLFQTQVPGYDNLTQNINFY